jgi:FtsP/CotA-like multicopper oxidase with cupredoxin domain
LRGAAVIGLGGVAAAACAPFGAFPALSGARPTAGASAQGFKEPVVRASSGGLLETTLEARLTATTVAGRPATTLTYEGTVPGPTLRVRPGDRVRVKLVNRLDEPTNLHFHGLHVPPTGNADNPFLHAMPGETLQYEFAVPADHPAGTFWYHPHIHGSVADQVFKGLVGAIVIEGDLDRVPAIAAASERLLILKDTTLDAAGRVPAPTMMERMHGREGALLTINGLLGPSLELRPGEVQRWRLINASNARYYRLRLDGHRLHQIAGDFGPLPATLAIDELLLPPAKRADVLVQAGSAGSYKLATLAYDRGGGHEMIGGHDMMGMDSHDHSAGDVPAEGSLLELVVRGDPISAALPERLLPVEDANSDAVAARRQFVLSEAMGPGGMVPMINGRVFDETRLDTRVRLGTTEEWTVSNDGEMDHAFHLHTNPFRVVAVNGQAAPFRGWEDTVNVRRGESVTLRVRFRDFAGKTVYHCHILEHEDLGMMGTVEAG